MINEIKKEKTKAGTMTSQTLDRAQVDDSYGQAETFPDEDVDDSDLKHDRRD